jgi:hypothetical protein
VRITAPGGASGQAVTDDAGVLSSLDPALTALAGGTPIGEWSFEILSGASLMDGDNLRLDRVYDLQLGLEYEYAAVAEAL